MRSSLALPTNPESMKAPSALPLMVRVRFWPGFGLVNSGSPTSRLPSSYSAKVVISCPSVSRAFAFISARFISVSSSLSSDWYLWWSRRSLCILLSSAFSWSCTSSKAGANLMEDRSLRRASSAWSLSSGVGVVPGGLWAMKSAAR